MDRWLAVGLTNPEGEYGGTRHNIGADVIRALAARQSTDLKPHKAQALVADTWDRPGGTPLTLAVPFGYMNNSGGPVQQLVRFYKMPTERVIVVADELDLEPGVLKLKRGGTSGHNGFRDVKNKLGADDYIRLRFGIGRPPGQMPGAKYVLGRFSTSERAEVIDVAVEEAADTILRIVGDGFDAAQNRLHTT
ncbi:aminoacyl-tRNA hydrolase [Euzebya tangerina]|uniref:aminoacyl-tRNA hydrolase n=1 Tax=Euzebya tangerina TaxID=591198 RepID=UPI000E310753|nr:aminoacyl-tRNA hydrolase [Euzebya tangerina]